MTLQLYSFPCQFSLFSKQYLKPIYKYATLVAARVNPIPTNYRRSANYKPNIWKEDFFKSLKSNFNEPVYSWRTYELREEVKQLLNTQTALSLAQLELIDDLERLGMGYVFEKEIKMALDIMGCTMNEYYENNRINNVQEKDDLRATSLCFRLLRQHGYEVSQDVFKRFMDQDANTKECHQKDVEGMLSLFEASNLATEGESILERANAFTSRHLKVGQHKGTRVKPDFLGELVDHSLELPLHLRPPRLEARWYIDQYHRKEHPNHKLLELSKLEFNLVQSIHQEDLVKTWKWWNDLGLSNKLSFSRDRLVECFYFITALFAEPQFRYCRKEMTKISCLIITIDDVYDVYGTLDELELFTDAVQRWDINAISHLPYYMKMIFSALYNTINEIAYDTLKENTFDISPYLKKAWEDQCKAFLVEAKWYHSGYIPTLEEYMNNALVTAGGPLMLLHAYLLQKQDMTTESLDRFLESKSNLIRWSSLILRLTDDLATSTAEIQRGDVSKSIQCYMHETGASEEVAREYIKCLTNETWKKLNGELLCMDSSSTRSFISIALNLARMSECIFQYGDGLGIQDQDTKAHILSLFVEPTV